jgi:hypothetical protein
MRRSPFSLIWAAAAAACANGNGGLGPDGPASASVVQGQIEYRADTQVMESFPVQLHTIVTLRNRSSARASVELGSGCPVHLRAYRDEARTRLAWDQGRLLVCTMQIQSVELAPGDADQRGTRTDARQILGDSLPDGRYWLGAYVQVVGAPLVVPAGSADLAVPR